MGINHVQHLINGRPDAYKHADFPRSLTVGAVMHYCLLSHFFIKIVSLAVVSG